MERLKAFLVLLDIRYLPLLLLASPQSYAVALWLSDSNSGRFASDAIAVLGAVAFEFGYVGAIAWASATRTRWFWATALASLGFSVLVAVKLYDKEFPWNFLHAGFPLVAFCYTILIHMSLEVKPEVTTPAQPKPELPEPVVLLATTNDRRAKLKELVAANPLIQNTELARELGVSATQIYKDRKKLGI